MKRITLSSLASSALLLLATAPTFAPDAAAGTPNPTSAVVKERIFNDCPFSTLTVVNNFPSLISIEDADLACGGFANLHNWSLSEDGVTQAAFDNNSDFRISTDLVISGTGNAEAGIRISPWWSKDVDGRFNVRVPDGEIACFGGRLPFYTFTGVYGLHYQKGQPIHLEVTYKPHGLNASSPATAEYKLTYQGTTYSSGALNFDMANPAEDPPYGLWGMLNDGRVGGHMQAFMQGGTAKATFSNTRFVICPIEPNPADAVVRTRIFNDCPFSNLTVVDNYPSEISFNDAGLACGGFANMHVWTFSDDGNNETVLNNDDDFHIETDLAITGKGEGGLRVSPWWSHNTDGLFNVRSTDGEIACFGGRLPFYSFSGAHGLRYTPGTTIHLEMTYKHNGLSAASPGTMTYDVTYQGASYSSGPLSFDEANPAEDPPHGRWGILNDARAGGHMKAFMTEGDLSATTNATFTNMVFDAGVHLSVDVDPNTLNLKSGGRYVTAYIEGAGGLTAGDIDVHSLRLNGVTGAASTAVLGDHDGDGIADLAVKFPRIAVHESAANTGLVVITGSIGDFCFDGSDQVRLIGVLHPAAGVAVARGSTTTVRWQQVPGSSAAIHYSLDDGDSWTLVAEGLPNSGSYAWSVPDVTSSTARVAVVVDDGTPAGVAGISGQFSIQSIVGVGGGEVAFGLSGAIPNPSKAGPLSVRFSLPDAKRATLSLFDVSGRRLASRDVGEMGAGRHLVTLAQRLPAGLYVIRLAREGKTLMSRAAVVR